MSYPIYFEDYRKLRYFLAVAREENMSKAAEQLHVSQPTLSKTLNCNGTI